MTNQKKTWKHELKTEFAFRSRFQNVSIRSNENKGQDGNTPQEDSALSIAKS